MFLGTLAAAAREHAAEWARLDIACATVRGAEVVSSTGLSHPVGTWLGLVLHRSSKEVCEHGRAKRNDHGPYMRYGCGTKVAE